MHLKFQYNLFTSLFVIFIPRSIQAILCIFEKLTPLKFLQAILRTTTLAYSRGCMIKFLVKDSLNGYLNMGEMQMYMLVPNQ